MILIVNLKKFSSSQKRNIKRFYSCLEFNYRQHSERKLTDIGTADVVLFQLDLSVFFSISNNKLFKYLQEQDLSKFQIVFVYERTKYKQIFNTGVRWAVRKFPLLTSKNIEEALDITADHDQETKSRAESLTAEQFRDILVEPLEPDVEENKNKIPEDLDQKINEMETLLDYMRGLRDGSKAPTPNAMSGLEKPKLIRQRASPLEKKKVHTEPKKFVVKRGNTVIKEFPFSSAISRRKARKAALLFSQS
jgi:hypothetical protein